MDPGVASAAAPTFERITIDDTFVDEDLSETCGVLVTVTVKGEITPTQRFEPVAQAQRELLALSLPGALAQASELPASRRGARRCGRYRPYRVDQRRSLVGRPPGAGRGDAVRPARRDRIEPATLMFASPTAVNCCARALSRSSRTRSARCAARPRAAAATPTQDRTGQGPAQGQQHGVIVVCRETIALGASTRTTS